MSLKEVKTTEKNTVEMTIEVKGDAFKKAVDNAFKKNISKIQIPGFRKGKAPRHMVEKMYGEGIFFEDAVNELYPAAYDEAVKEAKISPVDKANVEIVSVNKEGFVFKAKVTVKPVAEVKNYKGIKATKTVYNVLEKDVKNELERLQKQNARIQSVDRAAKENDTVTIDFEGFVDDKAFEGGKGENHDLVLGSGSFIPGFEDQLIGAKKGDDVDVKVTFPKDYHAEDLKGKDSLFKVKVKDVKETILPEIDDEFVKDVSEFDTLAELKKDIKAKFKESNDKRSESELEKRLVDELNKNTTVDIPQCMIEQKLDAIAQDFDYKLRMQGMDLATYLKMTNMDMASFRKSFEEEATNQVKTRLALEKVVELEKIVVSDEDIEDEFKNIADAYQMPIDEVKKYITKEDITLDIAVGKAVEFIKNQAEVTEEAYKEPAKKAPAKKSASTAKKAPAKKATSTAAKKPAAKKTTTTKKTTTKEK